MHAPCAPRAQAARITREVMDAGVQGAGSTIQLMRAPWLLVEGPENVKVNRDGEPSSAPSARHAQARAAAVCVCTLLQCVWGGWWGWWWWCVGVGLLHNVWGGEGH